MSILRLNDEPKYFIVIITLILSLLSGLVLGYYALSPSEVPPGAAEKELPIVGEKEPPPANEPEPPAANEEEPVKEPEPPAVEETPSAGGNEAPAQSAPPAADVKPYYDLSGAPPTAPGLHMKERQFNAEPAKIVYLTFDDGPYPNTTPKILNILRNEGIKGTFFMVGTRVQACPDLVKQVYNDGNAIGNHTYTHIYHEVYESPNHFLREIQWTEDLFAEVIGFRPKLVRAPGGTENFNVDYFNILDQSDYMVYDWNASNDDSTAPLLTADQLVQNVRRTTQGKDRVILLMHDLGGKTTTVEALPRIISYLREQGYEFGVLSEDVMPILFSKGFRQGS